MAHYIITFDFNDIFKHMGQNHNFNLHLINHLNLRCFFMSTNLNHSIYVTLSDLSLPLPQSLDTISINLNQLSGINSNTS
jgi:hypothetical protein